MTNTVKLQGIYGQQAAKPVKDLKPGDIIRWNFGYTSLVIDLVPSKTGKTITAVLKESECGNIVNRKMGANRLVAIG